VIYLHNAVSATFVGAMILYVTGALTETRGGAVMKEIRGMKAMNEAELTNVQGGVASLIYWGARGAIYVARNPQVVKTAGSYILKGLGYVGAGQAARTAYDKIFGN